MKTSESIGKIASALLKAQKEMEGAKKGSDNPFFKSKYSDFTAVLEVCKGPLNNNGISVIQPITVNSYPGVSPDGTMSSVIEHYVETILVHESGEFMSSLTPIKAKDLLDPQKFGAGVTYARRQGLQSMLSIPAEDDDGNTASGNKAPKRDGASKPAKSPAKPDKKDTKRKFTRGAKADDGKKEEPKKEEEKKESTETAW